MEFAASGLLDAPLEPVIGLAEGETRWRGVTAMRGRERATTMQRRRGCHEVSTDRYHRGDRNGMIIGTRRQ